MGLLDGEKNIEDMYKRFDRIPGRVTNKRTDRQTDEDILLRIVRAMHTRHAVKTVTADVMKLWE